MRRDFAERLDDFADAQLAEAAATAAPVADDDEHFFAPPDGPPPPMDFDGGDDDDFAPPTSPPAASPRGRSNTCPAITPLASLSHLRRSSLATQKLSRPSMTRLALLTSGPPRRGRDEPPPPKSPRVRPISSTMHVPPVMTTHDEPLPPPLIALEQGGGELVEELDSLCHAWGAASTAAFEPMAPPKENAVRRSRRASMQFLADAADTAKTIVRRTSMLQASSSSSSSSSPSISDNAAKATGRRGSRRRSSIAMITNAARTLITKQRTSTVVVAGSPNSGSSSAADVSGGAQQVGPPPNRRSSLWARTRTLVSSISAKPIIVADVSGPLPTPLAVGESSSSSCSAGGGGGAGRESNAPPLLPPRGEGPLPPLLPQVAETFNPMQATETASPRPPGSHSPGRRVSHLLPASVEL